MIDFKKRKTVLNFGLCLMFIGAVLMIVGIASGKNGIINHKIAIPALLCMISSIIMGVIGKSIKE